MPFGLREFLNRKVQALSDQIIKVGKNFFFPDRSPIEGVEIRQIVGALNRLETLLVQGRDITERELCLGIIDLYRQGRDITGAASLAMVYFQSLRAAAFYTGKFGVMQGNIEDLRQIYEAAKSDQDFYPEVLKGIQKGFEVTLKDPKRINQTQKLIRGILDKTKWEYGASTKEFPILKTLVDLHLFACREVGHAQGIVEVIEILLDYTEEYLGPDWKQHKKIKDFFQGALEELKGSQDYTKLELRCKALEKRMGLAKTSFAGCQSSFAETLEPRKNKPSTAPATSQGGPKQKAKIIPFRGPKSP